MSNQDNRQPGEQELHELYHSLAKTEPPPSLDRNILEAAREEISQTQAKKPVSSRAWYVPVSMAAVVLISFSLVITLVVDEQALQPESDAPIPMEVQQFDTAADQEKAREDVAVQPLMAPRPPAAAVRQSLPETEMRAARETSELSKKALQSRPAPATQAGAAASIEERLEASPDSFMERKRMSPDSEPDILLRRLLELYHQGEYDQLGRELADFRERYPGYELPDELQAWENRGQPATTN